MMLYALSYTHECRSYSATLYPTGFTLDSLLILRIRAKRKTPGWYSTPGPMVCGDFLASKKKICAGVVETRIEGVLKGEWGVMTTLLLQYVARFDGGGEIVGFGWGGCKERRWWCSLFVGLPSLFVTPSGEQLALPVCW